VIRRSTASARTNPAAIATLAPWLIALRWAIVALLAASLPASARWLALRVSFAIALPAVGSLAAVNLVLLGLRARARRATGDRERPAERRPGAGAARSVERSSIVLGASVVLDMTAIAIVLGASGGPANPFSALLFVYVALAASLMPARVTYALAALAACTFGALFFAPAAPGCASCSAGAGGSAFSNHLVGMWVAFALSAALVVFFLARVRQALEERDRAIAAFERRGEEAAAFAALGTLAAGAAHELATPLGTIAVLADEIASGGPLDAGSSARAISAQVERCRDVLRRLKPGAERDGARGGAPLASTVVAAVEAWRAAHPDARVLVHAEGEEALPVSASDVEAALGVLLDNALEASGASGAAAPIVVDAGSREGFAWMSVTDAGEGVDPAIAGRLGEPFLTTREPGEGMGLGLYVVRTLVESAGGRLEIAPNAPAGTRVSLVVGCGAVPATHAAAAP
jgi:two-component system sensor histidine kinase RegB